MCTSKFSYNFCVCALVLIDEKCAATACTDFCNPVNNQQEDIENIFMNEF